MTFQVFRLPVLIFLLLLPGSLVQGQDIALGHWRHHLPNNRIIALTETSQKVIGATPYGLVVFSKDDNSLEKINKVHGLSDFGISALAHSPQHDLVLVGYENGNLDLIHHNNTFINIPDILRANILGSKSINNILIRDQRAFLSCGFGIVELDLVQYLIQDTYFIGPMGSQVQVFDLTSSGSRFYAATNAGVLSAPLQGANLVDYQNWTRETVSGQPNESFNHIASINGQIIANREAGDSDTLYLYEQNVWKVFNPSGNGYFEKRRKVTASRGHLMVANPTYVDIFDEDLNLTERIDTYYEAPVRANDALFDNNQQLWLADNALGLVRRLSPTAYQRIVLPGPPSANAFALVSAGGRTWVAPGAISEGGTNAWNQDGIFLFEQGSWRSFNRFEFPQMQDVADLIDLAADPGNPDRLYAASWSEGVLEFTPQGVETLYDDSNSPLQRRFGVGDQIRIGGVAVDRRGNLWVANSDAQNPIAVKKENGQWLSFPNRGIINPGQLLGNIEIDQQGQKWVILPLGNGIYLFKENSLDSQNDFQARRLTTQENYGGLPSNNVHSLAVDHDGYMWVGTDKGVAIYYSPQRAFSGEAFNAQQIVVEQDGFAAILLGTETLSAITVDGANKKWIGTTRSGVFLLSEDGRETIQHFTTDNSPLPSNHILDISVEGTSGEVFFATDRGLVSYRGMATEGTPVHTEVVAYPNPVRPHFTGPIAIKGLVSNAWVKITDIAGNLVYETIAEGGQAIWNGRDIRGHRPASGVYLVFTTNDDGSETMVTKILFIN